MADKKAERIMKAYVLIYEQSEGCISDGGVGLGNPGRLVLKQENLSAENYRQAKDAAESFIRHFKREVLPFKRRVVTLKTFRDKYEGDSTALAARLF